MSTSPATSYEAYEYDVVRNNTAMSNAAPPRAENYLQPVALTPQQQQQQQQQQPFLWQQQQQPFLSQQQQPLLSQQQQPLPSGNGYGALPPNSRKEFFRLDTRYLRSFEGIVRFLSLPLPFIGLILAWNYLITGGEAWYAAVGFAYLLYVAVVFLIETLLAEIFVHRLVDGIITTVFAASWLSAAVALTVDAITQAASAEVIPLGAPAAFAYAETPIVILSAVLAFRTWKINGGTTGSVPLC